MIAWVEVQGLGECPLVGFVSNSRGDAAVVMRFGAFHSYSMEYVKFISWTPPEASSSSERAEP
jgi:hypothetical protein